MERDVLRISEGTGLAAASLTVKELVNPERQLKIEEISLPTGDADRHRHRLHRFRQTDHRLARREMIVNAARSRQLGKTSLLRGDIAEHVALDLKVPVGVAASLEMTADQLILRMLCSRSRVSICSIRDGYLAEQGFSQIDGGRRENGRRCRYSSTTKLGTVHIAIKSPARRMWQPCRIRLSLTAAAAPFYFAPGGSVASQEISENFRQHTSSLKG